MAAEDAAAPVPPASPFAQVLENIRNLSQRQKIAAGAALAFAIALVVGVILWSRQPDYAVLFSNLEEKDGGSSIAVRASNCKRWFWITSLAAPMPS